MFSRRNFQSSVALNRFAIFSSAGVHSLDDTIQKNFEIMTIYSFIHSFVWCLLLAVVAWAFSVQRKDAGIADVFWPWLGVGSAALYLISEGSPSLIGWVVIGAISISAARLSATVLKRTRRAGEDRRYTEIRDSWGRGFVLKSLPGIFLLQGLMGFVLALPLAYVVTRDGAWGLVDLLFTAVWVAGLLVQTVADRQLAAFAKADDGSGVLRTGVWRYSRHPNYFGELCMAWAVFGLAVGGGGGWTIIAPILLTWSILRFTGVSRMEKGISSRRPGYDSYAKVTSPLILWPPRQNPAD